MTAKYGSPLTAAVSIVCFAAFLGAHAWAFQDGEPRATKATQPSMVDATPSNTTILLGTNRQQIWLNASPEQRILLAEDLGEKGADALAKSRGYSSVLDGITKTSKHGLDRVFESRQGEIVVFEAKGGGSPLSLARGFVQGTPEWTVEAAKWMLNSPSTTAVEKSTALKVLEAVRDNRLIVEVVRTAHKLGEPTGTVVETSSHATPEATRMANETLKQFSANSTLASDSATMTKNVGSQALTLKEFDPATATSKLDGVAKAAESISKVAVVATKTLGGVAVVGGGLQIYQGAKECGNSRPVEGGADVAGGTANTLAGSALLAGKYALGGTAGGAAAIIDGGRDIYVGVRDGDRKRVAVGGVKSAAGTAMVVGTATGQPEIVVAGAIVYGGAVLYENKDWICEESGKYAQVTAIGAHAFADGTGKAAQRTAESTVRVAHVVANSTENATHETVDYITSAASTLMRHTPRFQN